MLETMICSSLEKVFPDERPVALVHGEHCALRGEVWSFQVAYRSTSRELEMTATAGSPLESRIELRRVGLSPSEMPRYEEHDAAILRGNPGLYPDPLLPIGDDGIDALPSQWHAIWISITVPIDQLPGSYPVTVTICNVIGETIGSEQISLTVIAEELPPQQLIHTEWFHQDCIATHYNVAIHSEEHWELLERYVQSAASHGINMLLTPIFTPPLDTEIGGERPTVQLVDVEVTKQGEEGPIEYQFGFSKLERWIDMCLRNGIQYFEFSHLATQWGAAYAPKIIAIIEGKEHKIFGWEDSAQGEKYRRFLASFLPELSAFIQKKGITSSSYFHISDEPHIDHLKAYTDVSEFIRALLPGHSFIDALSNYEFYQTGAVMFPIPATNHIEEFLDNDVPNLWTYHCCGQYMNVANRFFDMPSARNRILGYQLWKYQITGFLQWGFNFWYTRHSKKAIDPWKVTDAGHAFPSGDAFLVYPGEEGPVDSIRYEIVREAMQDIRLLYLAEKKMGRAALIQAIERDLDKDITFSVYPVEIGFIDHMRKTAMEYVRAT